MTDGLCVFLIRVMGYMNVWARKRTFAICERNYKMLQDWSKEQWTRKKHSRAHFLARVLCKDVLTGNRERDRERERKVKRTWQLGTTNHQVFSQAHPPTLVPAHALCLNLCWMPTADNYKPAGQASSVQREGWSLSQAWTPDLLHTPSVCCGLREVQDGSQQAVRQRGESERERERERG